MIVNVITDDDRALGPASRATERGVAAPRRPSLGRTSRAGPFSFPPKAWRDAIATPSSAVSDTLDAMSVAGVPVDARRSAF